MATINVSNSDSYGTIEVSPGDVIHITLSENPTTGYMWETTEHNSSQIELASDSFKTASSAAGGGGKHIFKFKVLAPGAGSIKLENRQKWEKDTLETFSLKYKSE
ncbi:protease inhibitor I42 family protein [Dyadobacter sp. NIV53]|uniref:protease inhibitor I42 family protein n=1 Tax=Dyadobacter sp. NIV53 TaxID=2861765 RepID=UPI001C86E9E7|nr:protease inhibitor I42 family protein [Dyadobacter sp. NIV53]